MGTSTGASAARAAGAAPRLAAGGSRALAFGPAAALTLLGAVDPVDSPAAAALHPDLIAGGSAVYWAAVARFAADLCARGRILPVLGQAGDGLRARGRLAGALLPGVSWAAAWRPVLTGPDAPRAAELAGQCRRCAARVSPAASRPGRCWRRRWTR